MFPYNHFDAKDRFLETELPPIENVYSALSREDISNSDYQHAQRVWQTFGIQDLGQYHDLYVLTDVLALADVFENFRNICLRSNGLDPCYFYTSPGLAWQAALKMTEVRLELLIYIDMHLFIEEGLRGGTSTISHRFSEANTSYLHDYNPNKPDSHILYLDANNLYGWAMSQALPVSDFEWLEPDEYPDATQIPDDGVDGYIFEVDLDYPQCLHDLHNDYPLAPERFKVTDDMLSAYAKSLLKDLHLHGTSMEKTDT